MIIVRERQLDGQSPFDDSFSALRDVAEDPVHVGVDSPVRASMPYGSSSRMFSIRFMAMAPVERIGPQGACPFFGKGANPKNN